MILSPTSLEKETEGKEDIPIHFEEADIELTT